MLSTGHGAVWSPPGRQRRGVAAPLLALILALAGLLGVLQLGAPTASAQADVDALGFAEEVVSFTPGEYYTGPNCIEPAIPNNQGGTASGALGAPDYGTGTGPTQDTAAALGNNGVLVVRMSVPFAGSGDTEPDIYVWEIGGGEGYTVEVSPDLDTWTYVGEVGPGLPGERGYDIDAYGFDEWDQLLYVRITDLAHLDLHCNPNSPYMVTGADIDAVGVLSRPIYADLAIEKTSDVDEGAELAVGDIVEYTFTVTNSGTVDLTDVTVEDALEGLSEITPESQDIPAGESATFTATYVIAQADINAGEVVNSATATGEPPAECEQCDTPTSPPGEDTIIIPREPALTVEKAADTDGPVVLGETITYTFTVENTGNVTLDPVIIADDLAGLVWVTGPDLGPLAPGEPATGTATYVVTEADVLAGGVTNSATATGVPPSSYDGDDPISPPDDVTVVTEDPAPALAVHKTADAEGPLVVDDVITYSFFVENTGNVTLTDVTIADPLPGLTWVTGPNLGDLAPGETAVGEATYVVTQDDVDTGHVTNTATATGTPPTGYVGEPPVSPPSWLRLPPEDPAPALALTKTAEPAGPVALGDVITYTFTATNTGNVTLADVTVTDDLPGLTWVTGPNLGPLIPGATATGTATYTVTEADILNGGVTNVATATGVPPASYEGDPPTTSTPPVEVPTVDPAPALAVEKTADTAGPVALGDTITYSFTATNIGNVTLTDVTVTDELPGLEWVSGPDLGPLSPGEAATGTATYVVTQADVDNGGVRNSATATGTPPGELVPPSSPPSEVFVPGPEPATGLTLTKSAAPADGVTLGDTITYTFTATNTGNLTLADVTIADAMDGLTWITGPNLGSLAPGESATGTATYVVTQADVNAGGVSNSATATGTDPAGGTLGSDPSTVTVPGAPAPLGLHLAKTSSPDTTVDAGETLTYTFVVTNTGLVTVDDVTISDPLPGLSAVEGPHGTSLAPGEQATFTATYTVTVADAEAGVVANTAVASGTGPLGEQFSTEDTTRIRACAVPGLVDPTPEPTPDATPTPDDAADADDADAADADDADAADGDAGDADADAGDDAADAGDPDAGDADAIDPDAGDAIDPDAGDADAGDADAGDAGDADAIDPDAGDVDAGDADAADADAGDADAADAGDAGDADAGDAGAGDAGDADAGAEDAGAVDTGDDGDAGAGRRTIRAFAQAADEDGDLADCAPLPVDPDPAPDPTPAPQRPQPQPQPQQPGGGSPGGGAPVTTLPSTGSAPATGLDPALALGLLAGLALALGGVALQVRRARRG